MVNYMLIYIDYWVKINCIAIMDDVCLNETNLVTQITIILYVKCVH